MNADEDKLIYLFSLTRKVPIFFNPEQQGDLLFIEIDGLYAAVKYVSESDYSANNVKKNISDVVWLDSNVREHLRIITLIMQMETVIPFNFGTIYKSEESLRYFVGQYANEFKESLQYLENKEEWSVKVLCNRIKIMENIGAFSQNVSDVDEKIKNSSPGKAYILRKKKKEIIDTEIKVIYNAFSKRIFTALNEFCEEYQFNIILSNELSERDEDMILNVVFFIRKENIYDFIKCTDQLTNEYEDVGMIFDITGPWPPYTFLKMLH